MRKHLLTLAAGFIALALLGGVSAKASTLTGETLTVTYYFPDLSTIYTADGGFPKTFIANSTTVQDSFSGGPFFEVSANASAISVTFLQGTQFADGPVAFDGIGISGILPAIIGVVTANLGGTIVTWDAHDVFFNFANLVFGTGDAPTAVLDFAAATTPLPSTWLMLIAGLLGLGYFAYRGTQKNSAALVTA
jgi:hypothetical protein